MKNICKKVMFIMFGVFYSIQSVYATPQFARENSINCTACHSSVPMLNDMGEMFLRNGFRLSPSDRTLAQKIKDKDSTIPAGMMLGIGYNSNTENTKPKVKIFSASPITSTLSYFISANKHNQNAYIQYNPHQEKHVVRAGFLSPFTQIGGINKFSANSGLKGNNGKNGDSSSNKQKGKERTVKNNNSDSKSNNSKQPYQTPLQNSYFRSFKGLEYSYLYDYNALFLISYGKTSDKSTNKKSNDSSNNNANNDKDPDSADKNQLILALSYHFDNYLLGFMYDKIENSQKVNYSAITFIQKEYQKWILSFAYIYKDNKDSSIDAYQGVENSIIYRLNDSSTLKLLVDIDDENGFNNKGYSLGYSKFFGNINVNISGAKRENITKSEDIIQTSIMVYF